MQARNFLLKSGEVQLPLLLPFPLEVGPLNRARESGECCKLRRGVGGGA